MSYFVCIECGYESEFIPIFVSEVSMCPECRSVECFEEVEEEEDDAP